MVISTGGAANNSFASLLSVPKTPSTESTNSFAQQLASALAGYLSQAGDSPHFEIDVQATPGQTSGTRQFLVTVRDPGPAAAPGTAASAPAVAPPAASAPAASASAASASAASASAVSTTTPAATVAVTKPPVTLMSIPRPPVEAAVPHATPLPDDGVKRLANGRPVLNSADAYWATQPPPVQALQNMNSEEARSNLAHDLANQGYSIDVPIMVWGWDPLATMIVRKNQGFTWVPSAKMDPVQVAPGINFGGLQSYDAANAPQGSIRVTTDWAKGLEYTDGWLHPGDY